jgi:hypothetical protein
MRIILTFMLMLLLAPVAALAATAPAAAPGLTGAVKAPVSLDQTTLLALPATTVELPYKSATGSGKDSYTGVLLWDLVKKARLVSDADNNADLKRTLLVTGANGYAVAIALAELDPYYGNKQVLLAYKANANLASFDHLKLIVPGDIHGGRSVRDVVSIEVK